MKRKSRTHYFKSGEQFSPTDFSSTLWQFIKDYYKKNGPQPILFLCIGSDRITGDSLGPFIGYRLEQLLSQSASPYFHYQVLGTLSHPVHALNLTSTLHAINKHPIPHLTIAIDASIGTQESREYITLSNSPLTPGEGVNHFLPQAGQISITGIVSDESEKLPFHLHNIRLNTIIRLADCICSGLTAFLYSYNNQLPVPAAALDFPDKMLSNQQVSACTSNLFQDEIHIHP